MPAWGLGNFENDTALDFVDAVIEEGRSLIKYAIQNVAQSRMDEYVDCSDAEECLAAAEYVAAALGKPSADLPEDVGDWVGRHDILKEDDVSIQKLLRTSKNLVQQAQDAVYRVRNASELKELWDEAGEYDAWVKVLDDLRDRLAQ